jgi:hypothetical protein
MATFPTKRKESPKADRELPDLEQSKSVVLNSLASASSQRSYDQCDSRVHRMVSL